MKQGPVYRILHPCLPHEQVKRVLQASWVERCTVGWSLEDAGIGQFTHFDVEIFGYPETEWCQVVDWYEQYAPQTTLTFCSMPGEMGHKVTFYAPTMPAGWGGKSSLSTKRTYQLLHPCLSEAQALAVFMAGLSQKRTTGWSWEDAGIRQTRPHWVELYGYSLAEQQAIHQLCQTYYPHIVVPMYESTAFFSMPNPLRS